MCICSVCTVCVGELEPHAYARVSAQTVSEYYSKPLTLIVQWSSEREREREGEREEAENVVPITHKDAFVPLLGPSLSLLIQFGS